MISKEEIKHMANLAKLRVEEEDMEDFISKSNEVLDYLKILDEVDLEGVEPLYQVYDYKQVLREDKVEEGLSRDEVLQNTVEKQYGYFKLLNIMD